MVSVVNSVDTKASLIPYGGMSPAVPASVENRDIVGEIPIELALEIFKYLSLPDLCRASAVCRNWMNRVSKYLPVSLPHGKIHAHLSRIVSFFPTAFGGAPALQRCYPAVEGLPAQGIGNFCSGAYPRVLRRTINVCADALPLGRCVNLVGALTIENDVPVEFRDFPHLLPACKKLALIRRIPFKEADFSALSSMANRLILDIVNTFLIFGDVEAASEVMLKCLDNSGGVQLQNMIERRLEVGGSDGFENWVSQTFEKFKGQFEDPDEDILASSVRLLLKHDHVLPAWRLVKALPQSAMKELNLRRCSIRTFVLTARSSPLKIDNFLVMDEFLKVAKVEEQEETVREISNYMQCLYFLADENTRREIIALDLSVDAKTAISATLLHLTPDMKALAELYRAANYFTEADEGLTSARGMHCLSEGRRIVSTLDSVPLNRAFELVIDTDWCLAIILTRHLTSGSRSLLFSMLVQIIKEEAYDFAATELYGRRYAMTKKETMKQQGELILSLSSRGTQENVPEGLVGVTHDDWDKFQAWTLDNLIHFDIELARRLALRMSPGDLKDTSLINIVNYFKAYSIAFHDESYLARIPELINLVSEGKRPELYKEYRESYAKLGLFDKCRELLEALAEDQKDDFRSFVSYMMSLYGLREESLDFAQEISDFGKKNDLFKQLGQFTTALEGFEIGQAAYRQIVPSAEMSQRRIERHRIREAFKIAMLNLDIDEAERILPFIQPSERIKARISIIELYEKVQSAEEVRRCSDSEIDAILPPSRKRKAEESPEERQLEKRLRSPSPVEMMSTICPSLMELNSSLVELGNYFGKRGDIRKTLECVSAIISNQERTNKSRTIVSRQISSIMLKLCTSCVERITPSDSMTWVQNLREILQFTGTGIPSGQWQRSICRSFGLVVREKHKGFSLNKYRGEINFLGVNIFRWIQEGFDSTSYKGD